MKNLTPKRIQELRTMPYEEYLQTPEWQEKRELALERDGYRCRNCNCDKNLHVHHRSYERRGNEDINDLTTLCNDCHEHFHKRVRLTSYMGSPDDVMHKEKEEQERNGKGNVYKWESYLIGLLIQNPGICPHVAGILAAEDFEDTGIQELYRIYLSVCQRVSPVSQPFEHIVPSELSPLVTRVIQSFEQQQNFGLREPKQLDEPELVKNATQCIIRLKREKIIQEREELNHLIREAAATGDRDLERQLMQKQAANSKLLRLLYISSHLQG